MANKSINNRLYGIRRVGIKTASLLLEVDVVNSEETQYSGTLTKHPVENGTSISDYFISNPEIITLDCIFSDTPMNLFDVSGSLYRLISDSDSPSKEIYTHLRDNVGDTLFEIITEYNSFTDMILTDMRINRDQYKSGGLFCTLTFEKVTVAYSDSVEITAIDDQTTDRVNQTKNNGNQKTKSATNKQNRSILKHLSGPKR